MSDLGLLQIQGVPPAKPTKFYPLSTQKFFSGLWTQRSPFNGPDNRYNTRFLGGRPDILIDGSNVELTNYGTYIRRPGTLQYSTQTVDAPILSFYTFRQILNTANPNDIMVDTATSVYKLTPTAKTTVFTKTVGAGQMFFQGVGNTLYMADGIDLRAWNDPVALQNPQTSTTRNWGISIGLFSTAAGPQACGTGTDIPVTGASIWTNPNNITADDSSYATSTVGPASSTSSGPLASTTESQSGSSYTWSLGSPATVALPVPPGNTESNLLNFSNLGFNLPANATVLGVVATITRHQVSGTSAVDDSEIILSGVTGSTNHGLGGGSPWPGSPTAQVYGTSSDLWGVALTPAQINSSAFGVRISCQCTGGPGNGAVASVDSVTMTVYYSIPTTGRTDYLNGTNFGFTLPAVDGIQGILVEIKGFQATAPAGSFLTVQMLKNGLPVGIQRTGIILPGSDGYVSLGGSLDLWGTTWSASDLNATQFGVSIFGQNSSGSSVTWNLDFVRITAYGTGGPTVSVSGSAGGMSAVNGGYQYVVAYGNSNAGHVSSTTPASQSTGNFTNKAGVNVTVVASTDPQVNQIWIFRTKDGGSTFYNLPTSPYPNTSGTILDSNADSSLVIPQQAPLAPLNNPPPAGMTVLAYHVNRVWGAVGNILYFSGGPDTLLGNGAEAWPPANFLTFPNQIHKLVPTATGLLVFTTSDIWLVVGTSIATFYPVLFQEGVGLLNFNALDVQGSNIFLYTVDKQFLSVTASGINEIGFGIGNQLEANFNPNLVYVASITAGTRDKAVFIADGSANWYRCNWNQPPEGGPAWSPKATLSNGVTAMASVETSPGIHQIMLGQSNGVVSVRSLDTFTDNGTTYAGYLTLGSLVLAQPGQLAEVESITIELPNIGSVPTISVLIDEVAGSFESIPNYVNDPPMLVQSQSLISKRFYLIQGNVPIVCRHLQVKMGIPAEAVQNELYTLSIWGSWLAKDS